ncbi:hypothetical protein P4359_30970, partial [Bacillus thuringiensis]|nr:hypothetical protein [Bacillus thuringiensis]
TMFIVVFINGGYEAQTPTQSLQEVEYAVELTSVTTVVIMFILSFFIMIPMMYSMIQGIIQLRLLTIWVYNNHRKWFVVSLIGVDLLFTALTSLVM